MRHKPTHIIKMTIYCADADATLEVGMEEIKLRYYDAPSTGGIDVIFDCQLCGKTHKMVYLMS